MIRQESDLSIPGKCFIAGEYLALSGGPTLVAAVEPRFVLRAKQIEYSIPGFSEGENGKNPFHPKSLAGRWWIEHKNFYQQFNLSFFDPHLGKGGLGGSTAEFALLHGLMDVKLSLCEESQSQFDLRKMWSDYRAISSSDGIKPSGADLIGQVNGHLTMFDRNKGRINQFSWLFQNLGFMLFRTNKKLVTHEYLEELGDFSSLGFEEAMAKIIESLVKVDARTFVDGINEYAAELLDLGFVAEHTQNILEKIKSPEVLAKKGCGAMGADVICLIDRPGEDSRKTIVEAMNALGCTLVATEHSLTGGLRAEVLENSHIESTLQSLKIETLMDFKADSFRGVRI